MRNVIGRRAFLAALVHETNAFSPIPTTIDSFRTHFFRPSGRFELPQEPDTLGYGTFARLCLEHGIELSASQFALAEPSAPLGAADYRVLRDELLDDLRRAGAVDMVFLFMHGAQLAEGCDDVEGDVAHAVREIVGPGVPIAIELDLHGNITPAMLDAADLVIGCLEYPHTDYAPRARLCFDLLCAMVERRVAPTTFAWRVPLVGAYPTLDGVMHRFVERIREVERSADVLAVSAFHGFWLSDTEWSSGCVLVTTDGDLPLARRLGEELAIDMIAAVRRVPRGLSIDAALDEALAVREWPVVLSDRGDNPGGGAAGDSTHLLRALLERRVEHAALGMIWDPLVVDFVHRAGVGARLALRLGGKTSRFSGAPLDVDATVLAVRDDARQAWFGVGPPRASLGRSVALRIDGVDVVVNSARQQVFDTRCFTEHGIDLATKRLVVVKSTAHFRQSFVPIAGRIVDCDSPGNVTTDPAALAYRHIPRPIYPLDRDFDMRPTPLRTNRVDGR